MAQQCQSVRRCLRFPAPPRRRRAEGGVDFGDARRVEVEPGEGVETAVELSALLVVEVGDEDGVDDVEDAPERQRQEVDAVLGKSSVDLGPVLKADGAEGDDGTVGRPL
jgi:hypothetical protein